MTVTLFRGGRVYSPAEPAATALLVDGERVGWLGSEQASAVSFTGVDQVVELDGALVTPAFVDAHVHTTSTGLAVDGLDLSGAGSLGAALDALAQHSRRLAGRPVLGHGWDETRWPERRPPTRAELDRASYGGVVYLSRVDVHSAVVSSALLAARPEVRTLAGYAESGHLTTDAHHAARRVAYAALTPGQRQDAQRATRRRASELGIGCLHELAGPDISAAEDLAELLALAAAEPGPQVLGYWGEVGGVATARELGALGAAGDVFVDGSLGSHTACLSTPYSDRPASSGHRYLDVADIAEHAVACTEAGLQAGFHAIGDQAVRTVVRGYAAAAERVGRAAFVAARHRVEHLEMVDRELAAELARLGVVASVQPVFDALWGGSRGMYADRLGPDRALATNPFADLAAAGLPLAFGSDAPVTPLGPWQAVRAASRHHVASQRISVEQAFDAHTVGGWRAAGQDQAGVLTEGAAATFAVWSTDPAQRPPASRTGWSLPVLAADLPVPQCVRTVVRGVTTFERA